MGNEIGKDRAEFADHMLDAMFMVDTSGRIQYVSAACEGILGYTPKEITGQSIIDLVVQDDRDRTLIEAREVMAGKKRIGFENRSVLQPRAGDAPIPSASSDERLYAERPDLRAYGPRARFARMGELVGHPMAEDVEAGAALRAAIGEHDPEAPTPISQARRRPPAEHVSDRPVEMTPRSSTRGESVDPEDEPRSGAATTTAPAAASHPIMGLSAPTEPGDVLSLDPDRPGQLRLSTVAADPLAIGVMAGASSPGGPDGAWHGPIATSGVVLVRADAGYGAIRPGDLLTTSATPGHAMRATEVLAGTILGKAIDGLENGKDTIRVVLLLR